MVPKPTAPAIASGSADAGAAGYLLERQTRRGVSFFFFFVHFHTFFSSFLWQKIWEWREVQLQKEKKTVYE